MDTHFILTNARSGSNFLVNTINKHPAAVNYGELIGDWNMTERLYQKFLKHMLTREQYLEYLLSGMLPYYSAQLVSCLSHVKQKIPVNFKFRNKLKTIGFKDFVPLIERYSLQSILTKENRKVIHLYRSNIIQRYISWLILEDTKVASSTSGRFQYKVNIDLSRAMEQIREVDAQERLGVKLMESVPAGNKLSIEYETYFSSPESTAAINGKVFELLGLDPIEEVSSHKKMGSDNLESRISNYGEFVQLLKGSAYEKYLN